MKRQSWESLIGSLPPRMSQVEAAKFLDKPEHVVRYWIKRLRYQFEDGRKRSWTMARRKKLAKFFPENADWTKTNVMLHREHGVSRERIRQVRNRLNIPKVFRTAK